MVSLLLQPLVCNDVLELLFFVDIPISRENINIILRFEALYQVDDRTDGATRFKCWGIPITEDEEFCFYVMVKLSFLNTIFLEPVT